MDASDTLARPYLRLIPEEFSREIALLYLIIALCIESAQMPPACAASNLYPIHTTNRSEAKRTEAKRSEPYCRIRTIHTSTECAAMRIPQFASFHTAHSRMRFVSHWKRSEAKRTIECCYG